MFIKKLTIISAILLLSNSQAKALTTFNFDEGGLNGLSDVNLTEDGISLTISSFVSQTNLSKVDFDGLCFAGNSNSDSNFCQHISFLQLEFSKPVKLISYVTGWNTHPSAPPTPVIPSLSLSQGSLSSLQTSFPGNGSSTPFNNQFLASSGIPILVTNNNDNSTFPASGSSVQFRSLTVEDVPGPLPLMGAACALGYSRKLRRRISTTRPNP